VNRIAVFAILSICGSAQTLRQAADRRIVKAGTAADYDFLTEADYTSVLAREYSQLQPENDMKWSVIHPGPTTYAFGNGDGLVSFAAAHGMAVRGHVLVWHNQNPGWLTNGNFPPDKLSMILEDHINKVMAHYAGKVYAWDVVNEAFNDDGTLRDTIWYNQPGIGLAGTAYIERAFRLARIADPQALLFYNDFSAETLNAKSDAIFAMVKDFKARGVPIDGVGLQLHLTSSGISFPGLDANVKRLTGLGLQVQFTELDVRLPVTNNAASAADLLKQATIYHDVAAVCLKYPLCTAIQTWGFTDKHSWIPGSFPGSGAALPFDAAYQIKPAYTALQAALATTPPVIDAAGLLNAASFTGSGVSPGEIVTLFGANYGPAALVDTQLDSTGRIADDLEGTRLFFDGAPAPVIYSIAGQATFVVPYAVQDKTTTQVQYQYNGIQSNTVTVPVVATEPALFTANSQGSGPGAILNVDYSYNSAANPVAKGGVVLLFGTGEGQTTAPGVDGLLAVPPYPAPLAKVSVTVDGQPADILYAGAAPTLVAGLLQLDVVIPPTASSGAVPVLVTIGNNTSQAGVTVAVK
jgi:endo-1,4-beta-xylanase